MPVVFLLLLIALSAFPVKVAHAYEPPVLIDRHLSTITLGAHATYLSDPASRPLLQLLLDDDLDWQNIKKPPLNLNVYAESVWLKVDFRTGDLASRDWVLSIPWAGIERLEWHLYDHSQDFWTENGGNFRWASIKNMANDARPYSFDLQLNPGRHYTLYVNARSSEKLIVPMKLIEQSVFIQSSVTDHLVYGLFYGVLIAMLGYNLSLFIFVRDTSYAYYCFYVSTIIFYTLAVSGIGHAYVWHQIDWLNSHAYQLGASLAFFAAALFIRNFLSLSAQGGTLKFIGDVAVYSWLGILLVIPFFPHELLILLIDSAGTMSCLVGFGVSVTRWRQGDPSGKYMTIAWSVLILSTFTLMLGLTNQIPYRVGLYYFQYVGFTIEVLLLSMALAERISRERRERVAAEAQSIYYEQQSLVSRHRELQAQKHALDIERQAKEELQQKVEEQTSELKLAMYALEKANHELEHMSQVDALTSLFNRRYFDKSFKAKTAHAADRHEAISAMMIDVDHFKRVNDTYGHQAGDECLRQIGHLLHSTTSRHNALCARYGGEEFCVVVGGLSPDAALALAESLRQAIAERTIQFERQRFSITMSIGLITLVPSLEENPEKILKVADDALYQAKHNGRNRVEVLTKRVGKH